MKQFFLVALLVSLVSVSHCDCDADNALPAADAAPSKCSCILPLVVLPGSSPLTLGILNNLLQGGLLNIKDPAVLKALLGGQVTKGILNNLLQGGVLNGNVLKYLLGGGQITGGLLNNLLQAGILNAKDVSGLFNGQVTGGIGNNILQGGIGNGLLQALLAKGLLGGLLGGPLGALAPPALALDDGPQATAIAGSGPAVASTSDNIGLASGLGSNNFLDVNLLNAGGFDGDGGAFANAFRNYGVLAGALSGNAARLNVANGIL